MGGSVVVHEKVRHSKRKQPSPRAIFGLDAAVRKSGSLIPAHRTLESKSERQNGEVDFSFGRVFSFFPMFFLFLFSSIAGFVFVILSLIFFLTILIVAL